MDDDEDDSGHTTLVMALVTICTSAALVIGAAAFGPLHVAHGYNSGLRDAAACAPGMVYDETKEGHLICIGGDRETWVVER